MKPETLFTLPHDSLTLLIRKVVRLLNASDIRSPRALRRIRRHLRARLDMPIRHLAEFDARTLRDSGQGFLDGVESSLTFISTLANL